MLKVLIAPGHYLFSENYGSEPSWACYLVKHLADHVHQLDVIVGVSETKLIYPNNVKIIPVFKSRSSSLIIESMRRVLFYGLVSVKALRLYKKNHYDVVHHFLPLSTATYNPLFNLLGLLKIRSKKVLGPLQLPQINYSSTDLGVVLTGRPNKNLALNLAYKCVIKVYELGFKHMVSKIDLLLFNSKTAKNFYRFETKVKAVDILESGIEEQAFMPLSKQRKKSKEIVILSVGQLTLRKGHELLINAFDQVLKRNPYVILKIVGSGEEESVLKKLVSSLKISKNVVFVGSVPHDHIDDLYNSCDIFCHTPTSDPSPTVILEAMYKSLPIVTVDIGSIKEMVGKGGIIVNRSCEEVASALNTLIENSKKRTEYGRLGYERVKEKYLWTNIAKKLVSMYK